MIICVPYQWQYQWMDIFYSQSSIFLLDIARFGSCSVDDNLIQKMQAIIDVPVHRFIRRRIFWSHRYVTDLLSMLGRAKWGVEHLLGFIVVVAL